MKKTLYYFGLICIAIFIFSIHAKYLHFLVPGSESDLFVFFGIDFKIYLPYVWGFAFGVVTAIIISLLQRSDSLFWLFVFAVAILEFIGVFLFSNTEIDEKHFKVYSSIYYGIYTGFIVLMYAYIKPKQENLHENANENLRKNKNKNAKGNMPIYENPPPPPPKKNNETEVWKLLSENKTPKEIAEELNINLSTVYRIKKNLENEQDRMD